MHIRQSSAKADDCAYARTLAVNKTITMNKLEIREECLRLFMCESIQDSYDLINVYLEYFFQVINNQHSEKVYSYANRDAKMVNQMIFTKVAHLKSIVEGINFKSHNGLKLNGVIDPTIVAALIRNVYETVAMFHLIYRKTKTDDEKAILYGLWVSAGLKYRQRFENVITTDENREKLKSEEKQINKIKEEIQETDLYKQLSEKNQNKILTKIKEKDYKIWFNEDNEVEFLSWQDITKVMGLENDVLDNIYSYFSLYSHPSNVAVFQFSDMFSKGDEPFKATTNHNLTNLFILLSIYAADYITLFPSVKNTFEKLSLRDQVVINFYNKIMRGDEYSINDKWKELE